MNATSHYQGAAKLRLAELDGKQEVSFFWHLPLLAFDSALSLVKGRKSDSPRQFASKAFGLLATNEKWKQLAVELRYWDDWTEDPVPFGRYHRVGDSALHTTILFAESVANVLLATKVQSLNLFDLDLIAEDHFATWQNAFNVELETMLIPQLSSWSMPELHRDGEILIRQVQKEIRLFERSFGNRDKSETEFQVGAAAPQESDVTEWMKPADALKYVGLKRLQHSQLSRWAKALGVQKHPTKSLYPKDGVELIRKHYGRN